ncbi:MAG: cell wall hydrolase [Candidatus Caldarchaeum sp.]
MTFTPQLVNNQALGGAVDAQLQVAVDSQTNDMRTGTITAMPQNSSENSASGVFDVSLRSQLVSFNQPVKVTVPPQSFIQVIYGESLQQGVNAKIGLSGVIRNRVNDSAFPNTYNAVITANQFASVGGALFNQAFMRSSVPSIYSSGYDTDVKIAADIFDTTQADITGGSLFFISPTATEMQGVNDALATAGNGRLDPGEDKNNNGRLDPGEDTGTTVFPPSLAQLRLFLDPNMWQVVVVTRVEPNTNRSDTARYGQPAFIFFRRRNSADPAAVRLP